MEKGGRKGWGNGNERLGERWSGVGYEKARKGRWGFGSSGRGLGLERRGILRFESKVCTTNES